MVLGPVGSLIGIGLSVRGWPAKSSLHIFPRVPLSRRRFQGEVTRSRVFKSLPAAVALRQARRLTWPAITPQLSASFAARGSFMACKWQRDTTSFVGTFHRNSTVLESCCGTEQVVSRGFPLVVMEGVQSAAC